MPFGNQVTCRDVASRWRELDACATTALWHSSNDIDIPNPDICPGVTSQLLQGWHINRLLFECKGSFDACAPDSISLVDVASEDATNVQHAVRADQGPDTPHEVH